MTPDDPRHGTRRGYYAHRRAGQEACAACKTAAAAAEARYELARIRGNALTRPATGTKRRLQALHAIGWTWTALSAELGVTRSAAEKWANEPRRFVYATTADRVADTYERLCMTIPEGGMAERARRAAARRGYRKPLEWDDIDRDPEPPHPGDEAARPVAALEDYEWLVEQGESPALAAARVGVQVATIDQIRGRLRRAA